MRTSRLFPTFAAVSLSGIAVGGCGGLDASNPVDSDLDRSSEAISPEDDCGGMGDDGPGVGDPCVVGIGACRNEGVTLCSDGVLVCSAVAGTGTAETCNGVDDDCNGIDDDVPGVGDECVVGIGACRALGVLQCAGDALACSAVAGAPVAETCNGIDDDCNGELPSDEGDDDADGVLNCAEQPVSDSDGDGLPDDDERAGTGGFVTDPFDADTDDDGVSDGHDAAPLHAACASHLYVWDDFTSDPASRWSVVKGNWAWDGAGGIYSNTDASDGNVTWLGPRPDLGDYVVEVRMRPDPGGGGDPGFFFRSTAVSPINNGGANYYVGLYPSSDLVILSYFNGRWNPFAFASYRIDVGNFYTVRVRAFGTRFRVEVNNTPLINATNGVYSVGSVGFRSFFAPASYDYILVCD